MLDATLTQQLAAHLTKVRQPIELVASLGDDAKSRELDALLTEIAALSDRITPGLRIDGWVGRAVWPLVVLLLVLGALTYRRRVPPEHRPADGGEEAAS